MTAYTIHEPERRNADILARAEAVHFVKEGLAWWALLFPLLWLLYNRMWLVLIGFVCLLAGLQAGLALAGPGEDLIGWATVALNVLFAFHANDLRRWTLSRRGYEMAGAVTGRGQGECELKYFSAWQHDAVAEPARSKQVAPETSAVVAAMPNKPRPESSDDVIGLFPETDR